MQPLSLVEDHNAADYEDLASEDFWRQLMEEPGDVTWMPRVHGHHGDAGDGASPRAIRCQR